MRSWDTAGTGDSWGAMGAQGVMSNRVKSSQMVRVVATLSRDLSLLSAVAREGSVTGHGAVEGTAGVVELEPFGGSTGGSVLSPKREGGGKGPLSNQGGAGWNVGKRPLSDAVEGALGVMELEPFGGSTGDSTPQLGGSTGGGGVERGGGIECPDEIARGLEELRLDGDFPARERAFFFANLLVRIDLIIKMILVDRYYAMGI